MQGRALQGGRTSSSARRCRLYARREGQKLEGVTDKESHVDSRVLWSIREVCIIDGGRSECATDSVAQQDLRRLALAHILSPCYVDLAFNLPTSSCGAIWNVLKEEISRHIETRVHIYDVDKDLLSFLEGFFSKAVVDCVKVNLHLLSKSFLGPGYAIRSGRISLASRIVDDLFWEYVGGSKQGGPLVGFMGEAHDADDSTSCHGESGGEWQEVRRRKGKGKSDNGRDQSRGGSNRQQHGRDGRGGGRRGGRRELPFLVSADAVLHFVDCERVEVALRAFTTPPKPPRSRQDVRAREQRRQRKLSIVERSFEFVSHTNVVEGVPYNPSEHIHGSVHLYHGSRASSFSSFQARGISPNDTLNEFQAARAFYVSNSIRHAFEHPLHYHPAGSLDNPVIILVADVDVEILHGDIPPLGESTPFSVLWFDEPNHEWAAFCEGNMNRTLIKHNYDIVIGHVCNPIPLGYEPLQVDLEGGATLTQLAFCTERAMVWMESCMRRVYFERRVSNT